MFQVKRWTSFFFFPTKTYRAPGEGKQAAINIVEKESVTQKNKGVT
ncbi:MAG TPA: hypothetical protein PLZ79_00640 [Burkholderiales bacterium]|nr:hypothetical protein [Burkholderiales bacterium]